MYRTLGHLVPVKLDDKELFIEYLSERLSILNESYVTNPISEMTFSYLVKEGQPETQAIHQDLSSDGLTFHNFNNMNLPISMDPKDYGTISDQIVRDNCIRYYVTSPSNKVFLIDSYSDYNIVKILGAIKLSWTDFKVSEGIFKRVIGKGTKYFMDGVNVLNKQQIPAKPFNILSTDKKL